MNVSVMDNERLERPVRAFDDRLGALDRFSTFTRRPSRGNRAGEPVAARLDELALVQAGPLSRQPAPMPGAIRR